MTNEIKTGLIEEKSYAFKRGFDKVTDSLPADEQKEKAAIAAESKKKESDKDKKGSSSETDNKTLQTTDPQENMQGPISSIMQTIKEEGEANDVVSKEEADSKKDENT